MYLYISVFVYLLICVFVYTAIGQHITLCYLTGCCSWVCFKCAHPSNQVETCICEKLPDGIIKEEADWCTLYCSMGVHKQYSEGGQESGVNQIKMKHFIWLPILNDGAWVDYIMTRHLGGDLLRSVPLIMCRHLKKVFFPGFNCIKFWYKSIKYMPNDDC